MNTMAMEKAEDQRESTRKSAAEKIERWKKVGYNTTN